MPLERWQQRSPSALLVRACRAEARAVMRVPWRKLALSLFVGIPLALLIAELGLRGARRLQGRSYDSGVVLTELLRMQSRVRDFVPQPDTELPIGPGQDEASKRQLHPYLGYEIAGDLRQLEDDWRWMNDNPDPENRRYDILIRRTLRSAKLASLSSTRSSVFSPYWLKICATEPPTIRMS